MSSSPTLGPIHPLVPAGEDLEPAIAFYEQKLGFKVIHREGDPLRLAVVQRDMSVIYLCKNSYQTLGSPTSLRIQVNDIDQLFAEYEAKDASIVQEKLAVKPWGPKEFVVYDPVGGCLTFFAIPGR